MKKEKNKMAKFDYKKWVTENKYGKTNEQNTGSLDPNPANVMAMQPTGSIVGMPTGSMTGSMMGNMPTGNIPYKLKAKRRKLRKKMRQLREQNEPVSYGYNEWLPGS